ncbi:hypothetical protein JB92DRAFT_3094237, partial [Gautieria morchelliformis]
MSEMTVMLCGAHAWAITIHPPTGIGADACGRQAGSEPKTLKKWMEKRRAVYRHRHHASTRDCVRIPAHGAPPCMRAVTHPWGRRACMHRASQGSASGERRLMGSLHPTGASSKYPVVEVPGYNVTGQPWRMT